MKIKTILASFLILLLASTGLAQAKDKDKPLFKKIVVFGESTSDIGNTWVLTGREIWDLKDWDPTDPYTLPTEPVPPLYDNGRWSNGPMWVEVLSELLNVRGRMTPSLDGGLNYAFTDALTGEGTNSRFSVWTSEPLPPPDAPAIGNQLLMHVDAKGSINRDHLVVLWVGANEIISSVLAEDLSVLDAAVANIESRIKELVGLGAKHILVPNQIDASGAPLFAGPYSPFPPELQPFISYGIASATSYFNESLQVMLYKYLENEIPEDVTLYAVDFYDKVGNTFSELNGCVNPYTSEYVPASFIYLNPAIAEDLDLGAEFGDVVDIDDDYFDTCIFWDTIHPTKAVHSILAEAALEFVE